MFIVDAISAFVILMHDDARRTTPHDGIMPDASGAITKNDADDSALAFREAL